MKNIDSMYKHFNTIDKSIIWNVIDGIKRSDSYFPTLDDKTELVIVDNNSMSIASIIIHKPKEILIIEAKDFAMYIDNSRYLSLICGYDDEDNTLYVIECKIKEYKNNVD